MNHIKLAYKNGVIKDAFEREVKKRISSEYSVRIKEEILQNALTNSDEALKYSLRLKKIRAEVKSDFETVLGVPIDVGFDPSDSSFGILQNFNTLLGISSQCEVHVAEQFRRALQMFAGSLGDEAAMEVATIYEHWKIGRAYAAGEIVKYGHNGVGDPQLYKIVSNHTSQEDWTPNETPALYSPIGLNERGYTIWSRPTGAHDAYNIGDIVDYNGTLYISNIDGNVWSPDEYKAGWDVYNV